MLSLARTTEIVDQLAAYFEVKAPAVVMTPGCGTSWYRPLFKRIEVRLMSNEDTVLHEFAHHLHVIRLPRDKGHHNEAFYWCLRHCIAAVGMKDYPWQQEYKIVQRWARRDGLIEPRLGDVRSEFPAHVIKAWEDKFKHLVLQDSRPQVMEAGGSQ